MSVLDAMEARLEAAGITTPIALSRIPDAPDTIITLRMTSPGPGKDRNADGFPALEQHAIQALVRVGKDDGVQAALDIGSAVYRALVGRHFQHAWGSDPTENYDWCLANHLPYHLGYDMNDRPLVVLNVTTQRWANLEEA